MKALLGSSVMQAIEEDALVVACFFLNLVEKHFYHV